MDQSPSIQATEPNVRAPISRIGVSRGSLREPLHPFPDAAVPSSRNYSFVVVVVGATATRPSGRSTYTLGSSTIQDVLQRRPSSALHTL